MATVAKIGPLDHGRPMRLGDFLSALSQEGFHYELIDGKLYVTPVPNLPEDRVERWLSLKFQLYSLQKPEIINYVTSKARLFVPGRRRVTAPEPDLAAYRNFPLQLPLRMVRWQDVSPILVGEVVSADDPEKDLVRNVGLYLRVPTIREYWVLDTREDPDQPLMRVYRRYGLRWRMRDVAFGETYATKLLPGFELFLDPRR
jgi:Uma2 family endonuclease